MKGKIVMSNTVKFGGPFGFTALIAQALNNARRNARKLVDGVHGVDAQFKGDEPMSPAPLMVHGSVFPLAHQPTGTPHVRPEEEQRQVLELTF